MPGALDIALFRWSVSRWVQRKYFLITTQIIRIIQGQNESGHTVQGNQMVVLSRISSNAEIAIAVAEPMIPAQGWWSLGGFCINTFWMDGQA